MYIVKYVFPLSSYASVRCIWFLSTIFFDIFQEYIPNDATVYKCNSMFCVYMQSDEHYKVPYTSPHPEISNPWPIHSHHIHHGPTPIRKSQSVCSLSKAKCVTTSNILVLNFILHWQNIVTSYGRIKYNDRGVISSDLYHVEQCDIEQIKFKSFKLEKNQ